MQFSGKTLFSDLYKIICTLSIAFMCAYIFLSLTGRRRKKFVKKKNFHVIILYRHTITDKNSLQGFGEAKEYNINILEYYYYSYIKKFRSNSMNTCHDFIIDPTCQLRSINSVLLRVERNHLIFISLVQLASRTS